MPQVFRITHEAGDLSEYDSTVIDGGDLSVAAAAALVGSYGLNVLIDDTTAIYGQKNFTLLSGPAYRFRFYIDPNSLTMAAGNLFRLCDFRNSSSDRALVSLSRESGQYNIYAFVVDDASVQQGTTAQPISDTVHFVEVLIRRATSATANDGSLTLWIDGNLKQQVTGIDLFNLSQPNLARLGAVTGIDAGTSGTFYLDDFILYNDATEIGAAGSGIQPAPTPPAVSCFASTPDPILRVTDGTVIIDLLASDSGWELTDPYWLPQIAQYKGGGNYVNSAIAEGQRFVSKEYDNVVETIPLSVRGRKQSAAIGTIRELLQLGRQAADYWTEVYEFDDVWLEAKPAGSDCLTGYARVIKMQIPELGDPFGQPFFTGYKESVMEGISLVIEREPLWRGVPPGEIIGPLYNLIKNPDFELWNFGIEDSQPDSWLDLETTHITGQNSRDDTGAFSGSYALKVRVSGSTLTGVFKGVSQVITGNLKTNTEYTVIAWVRSEGVSNGVGRILVTYSSQLEVYRSSSQHGWTLYTGKFTTSDSESETIAINCEILTTAANTDGTVYFDSLMLVEGDWEEEAALNILPYLSSSHIANHWDQPEGAQVEAGDINYVDVWNVPGDVDALVLLEMINNTTPASFANQVEVYETIRIGMRRTNDVTQFGNYHDPAGPTDTTASSNDRLESPNLNNNFIQVTSKTLDGPELILNNEGRFRAFARLYDPSSSGNPTLETRLSYFIGASQVANKVLDSVVSPVRQQWHIINLTANAAINFDKKYATFPPGRLGYLIEMKRATGSDKGYLDYVLIMPTDGGYIEANLDSPLSYLSLLTIDGISAQQSIYSSFTLIGFRAVYNTSGQQSSPVGYKGSIYLNVGSGNVYKFNNNTGSLVHSFGAPNPASLEVYNGKLMVASNLGNLYENDGFVFPGTLLGTNGFSVGAMKSFDGKLWMLSYTSSRVNYWDGSSLVSSLSLAGASAQDNTGIEVYKNKLYVGINAGGVASVYEYNPVSASWNLSIAFSAPVTSCRALGVHNDKLYAGTGPGGNLYVFDGSSWSLATTFIAATEMNHVYVVKSFDGKVYAGGRNTASTGGRIMTSDDGTTWEPVYDTTSYHATGMVGYQGNLYVTTGLAKSSGFDLLQFTPAQGNQYQVSDWRGRPFTAPPRTKIDPRRHRYFFSYDRPNFVNNADDAALVGLAFVPRYLALRGKD